MMRRRHIDRKDSVGHRWTDYLFKSRNGSWRWVEYLIWEGVCFYEVLCWEIFFFCMWVAHENLLSRWIPVYLQVTICGKTMSLFCRIVRFKINWIQIKRKNLEGTLMLLCSVTIFSKHKRRYWFSQYRFRHKICKNEYAQNCKYS